MKKLLIFISVIAAFAFTKSFVASTSIMITPNSKLLIKVKTNVNSFNCQYDVLKLNKPIPVSFENRGNKTSFERTTLVLDNVNFDCGGSAINNDFKELLKTKTHPKIFIHLKEINKDQNKVGLVQASIDLEIAGVTKSYTVPVELKQEESMLIKGVLPLNIRDFHLEPPKKAMGLIVVKDVIEINFELTVKQH